MGLVGSIIPKIFDNIGNIIHVKCPVLIIHGKLDDIIPYEMAEVCIQI